jgi:hypothetical protein
MPPWGEWECTECGYIETGEERPPRCPECGAPGEAFDFYEYEDDENETGHLYEDNDGMEADLFEDLGLGFEDEEPDDE